MSWGELLNRELLGTYATTDGLMSLVDNESLEWKPLSGKKLDDNRSTPHAYYECL